MQLNSRIALAAFLSASFCVAQQPPARKGPAAQKSASKKPATPKALAPVVAPGLVVVKDAETGAIRQATAAEIGALSPAGQPVADALAPVQVVQPNGSVSVQLGPESQVFSVVTRTPDGKLVMSEAIGEKAATDVVKRGPVHPAPAAPKGELQ
jgi:hypothetical protein